MAWPVYYSAITILDSTELSLNGTVSTKKLVDDYHQAIILWVKFYLLAEHGNAWLNAESKIVVPFLWSSSG